MRYIFLRPLQAVKNIMLLEGSHVKTSGYAVWVHIMIIIIVIAFIIIMSITKLCHSVLYSLWRKIQQFICLKLLALLSILSLPAILLSKTWIKSILFCIFWWQYLFLYLYRKGAQKSRKFEPLIFSISRIYDLSNNWIKTFKTFW